MRGAFIIVLATAVSVSAQDNCGYGLPCGPVPWLLPQLPTLEVPTPLPTQAITATPSGSPTPTLTPTATFTPTITPTPTQGIDAQELLDQLATLQAVIQATPLTSSEAADVPTLEGGAAVFWGYLRGLIDGLSLGVLTPLFVGFMSLVFLFLGAELLRFTLPLAGVLFGWLRKIVQLILDFIPG